MGTSLQHNTVRFYINTTNVQLASLSQFVVTKMKPKRMESEARRISIGLVKDVLENIFESSEIETSHPPVESRGDSNKRKCEEELVISTRSTRSSKSQKLDNNSGVFLPSDPASVAALEIPRLGSRIKVDNSAALAESNKAILDSLPSWRS